MKRSQTCFFASMMVAMAALFAGSARAADKDIVDTAVSAGSFKTLAAALGAADLVDALKSKGPFTVFAPTDDAFAKLPKGTVEELLKPENKEKLIAVLTYHVVPGQVTADKVVKLSGAVTLNGQRLDIAVKDGKVRVDNSTVTKADIHCSNGVIHVIDQVLLPAEKNLVETASEAGSFKTLLAAAVAAGLGDTLAKDGPFTVFAPTDEAFAKLPAGTVESLLKPENKAKLASILKLHVVSGRIYSDQALKAKKATSLQGQQLHISVVDGSARVNGAKLIATDIDASNGVIHVIDSVILPSNDTASMTRKIEHVVAVGSQTFNSGHHDACADLYMRSMRSLVDSGSAMPTSMISEMKHVISVAEQTHCPTQRSWTLRRGLDRAYRQMVALRK